jgi:hypothetical protein
MAVLDKAEIDRKYLRGRRLRCQTALDALDKSRNASLRARIRHVPGLTAWGGAPREAKNRTLVQSTAKSERASSTHSLALVDSSISNALLPRAREKILVDQPKPSITC